MITVYSDNSRMNFFSTEWISLLPLFASLPNNFDWDLMLSAFWDSHPEPLSALLWQSLLNPLLPWSHLHNKKCCSPQLTMFSQLMENSVASGEKQMILALLSCQTMPLTSLLVRPLARELLFSTHCMLFGLVLSSQRKDTTRSQTWEYCDKLQLVSSAIDSCLPSEILFLPTHCSEWEIVWCVTNYHIFLLYSMNIQLLLLLTVQCLRP